MKKKINAPWALWWVCVCAFMHVMCTKMHTLQRICSLLVLLLSTKCNAMQRKQPHTTKSRYMNGYGYDEDDRLSLLPTDAVFEHRISKKRNKPRVERHCKWCDIHSSSFIFSFLVLGGGGLASCMHYRMIIALYVCHCDCVCACAVVVANVTKPTYYNTVLLWLLSSLLLRTCHR